MVIKADWRTCFIADAPIGFFILIRLHGFLENRELYNERCKYDGNHGKKLD